MGHSCAKEEKKQMNSSGMKSWPSWMTSLAKIFKYHSSIPTSVIISYIYTVSCIPKGFQSTLHIKIQTCMRMQQYYLVPSCPGRLTQVSLALSCTSFQGTGSKRATEDTERAGESAWGRQGSLLGSEGRGFSLWHFLPLCLVLICLYEKSLLLSKLTDKC